MNIDIRNHIINNFKEDNISSLKNAIEDSIEKKEEITLPGMGVFLEVIWKEADDSIKNKLLELLEKGIKNK